MIDVLVLDTAGAFASTSTSTIVTGDATVREASTNKAAKPWPKLKLGILSLNADFRRCCVSPRKAFTAEEAESGGQEKQRGRDERKPSRQAVDSSFDSGLGAGPGSYTTFYAATWLYQVRSSRSDQHKKDDGCF